MSQQPKVVIDHDYDSLAVPSIPTDIPSFLTTDTKRSILKSNLRDYEADPVKLTPGLDTTQLSTSPIAEPLFSKGPRVRFASTDHIFQVKLTVFKIKTCY
jgi:hypothetical protein